MFNHAATIECETFFPEIKMNRNPILIHIENIRKMTGVQIEFSIFVIIDNRHYYFPFSHWSISANHPSAGVPSPKAQPCPFPG